MTKEFQLSKLIKHHLTLGDAFVDADGNIVLPAREQVYVKVVDDNSVTVSFMKDNGEGEDPTMVTSQPIVIGRELVVRLNCLGDDNDNKEVLEMLDNIMGDIAD